MDNMFREDKNALLCLAKTPPHKRQKFSFKLNMIELNIIVLISQ